MILTMIFVIDKPQRNHLVDSSEQSNEETVKEGWNVLDVERDRTAVINIIVLIIPYTPHSLDNLDRDDASNEEERDRDSDEDGPEVGVPHGNHPLPLQTGHHQLLFQSLILQKDC